VVIQTKDIIFHAAPQKADLKMNFKLSDEEAATLAWLASHAPGTKIKLQMALDT
jgi:hypothetical protein